jgi:hypothetical protein
MTNTWTRGDVRKLEAGDWLVASRSVPGAFRLVDWGSDHGHAYFTCTCPKGQKEGHMTGGNPCRHVLAVSAAEAKDGYAPRPPGRVVRSIFTD